ncbi:MAG: hypothetical protein HY510_01050 [Acidobacteria bacterium]|nr:hypothetical protein [Acidobacteriota bacterium]
MPAGAVRADVSLFYQSASKEYVTFLRHADRTTTSGADLYDAWRATGMSPPQLVTTVSWAAPPRAGPPASIEDLLIGALTTVDLSWSPAAGATAYRVYRYRTPDRSDSPVVLAAAGTSASNDVLRDGADYFYDVRGTNACGESPRRADSRPRRSGGRRRDEGAPPFRTGCPRLFLGPPQ